MILLVVQYVELIFTENIEYNIVILLLLLTYKLIPTDTYNRTVSIVLSTYWSIHPK